MRTTKNEENYFNHLKQAGDDCIFCKKDLLIKEYKHWILLKNKFPYDLVAKKHDMLAPTRHVEKIGECTTEELIELKKIVKELTPKYDCLLDNFPKKKTIPLHYHFHLLKLN